MTKFDFQKETAFVRASWSFFYFTCPPLIRVSGSERLSTSTLHRKGTAFVYNVMVPAVGIVCYPATNGDIKNCAT